MTTTTISKAIPYYGTTTNHEQANPSNISRNATECSSSETAPAPAPLSGPRRYRDVGRSIFNYLNLLGFLLSYVVVFFLTFFVDSLPSIGEVSAKYQTIVTPAGWAFVIWGPIYLSEMVFVVAQMLPQYRWTCSVRDGVSTWFVAACIFQSLWVILFRGEYVVLSLVAMILVEVCLVALVMSQYQIDRRDRNTWKDYFVLRFPFELHCGWITVATIINVNLVVLLVCGDNNNGNSSSAAAELAACIVSLGVIQVVATLVLFVPPTKPIYVIAFVLLWALYGILAELTTTTQSATTGGIAQRFSPDVIRGVGLATFGSITMITVMMLIRFAMDIIARARDHSSRSSSAKRTNTESNDLLSHLDIKDKFADSSAMFGSF